MKNIILLFAVLGMSMSAMATPNYPGSNCYVAPSAWSTPNVPDDVVHVQHETMKVNMSKINEPYLYDIVCPLPYLSGQSSIAANLYFHLEGRGMIDCSLKSTDKYGLPFDKSEKGRHFFDLSYETFIVSLGKVRVSKYGAAVAVCTVGRDTGQVWVRSYREK